MTVAKRPVKRLRRPRQARAQATVEAILGATARILSRHGWATLTTNRVAQVAGVSIGTLYEYFADKESLIEALLARHLDSGEAILAERASTLATQSSAMPLRDLIAGMVGAFVALHQDDPRLHRALSSEVPINSKTRRRVAALSDAAVSLVEQVLRSRRDLDAVDPALAARLLVDASDALTHRWYIDRAGAPLGAERLTAELVRLFERYLTPAR